MPHENLTHEIFAPGKLYHYGIIILVRSVWLVYTFILKDLSEVGSEIIPSDEELEESEPPLKKSKLRELEPEEKEVTVSVTLCIS